MVECCAADHEVVEVDLRAGWSAVGLHGHLVAAAARPLERELLPVAWAVAGEAVGAGAPLEGACVVLAVAEGAVAVSGVPPEVEGRRRRDVFSQNGGSAARHGH